MSDARSDILIGHREAERVHRHFDTRQKYLLGAGRIDIYRLAHDLGLPIMFRPLDGLLGVYLKDPAPGIMLTTHRPASVQRLTCAHELGHHWLRHEASLDGEHDIGFALGTAPSKAVSTERQADAFAFNLLMPRWLLAANLDRLHALGLHLPSPLAIYQLALRIGTSYMSCALTLSSYGWISRSDLARVLATKPKDIKKNLIPDVPVPDWHRDVWLLSEADQDRLEARQGDVLVARIREGSTAGFKVDTAGLPAAGFEILADRIPSAAVARADSVGEDLEIGGFPLHETIAIATGPGERRFELRQKRPWESGEGLATLQVGLKIGAPAIGLSELDRAEAMNRVALSA